MSTNPTELLTAAVGLNKSARNGRRGDLERRNRSRAPLHWPIVLFRSAPGDAVETVTENLSSSGFYCYTKAPLSVGEVLVCAMKIPANDSGHQEPDRQLECHVQVVRVEPDPMEGRYGVACHIEDYHFVQAPAGHGTGPAIH
jgi:hypothetical protein